MIEIGKQVVEHIASLQKPAIIGISGLGGAGKSTVAKVLNAKTNIPVISIDSFIKDRTISDYKNWEIMDFAGSKKKYCNPFYKKKILFDTVISIGMKIKLPKQKKYHILDI